MKPLLIVVCGDSSPRLPPELGGYDRWFARILDVPTHTADPRVVPRARRLERLSSDEMLEMATFGARVLHGRSVELARRYNVPLVVASSTRSGPGTRIEPPKEEPEMEQVVVRAITDDPAVRKVSLLHVPDTPGVAAKVFQVLGEAQVPVRLIVQAQGSKKHNDITLILPSDAPLDEALLQKMVDIVGVSRGSWTRTSRS